MSFFSNDLLLQSFFAYVLPSHVGRALFGHNLTLDLIPSVVSVFTLFLPEVKGGVPDLILAEEIRVRKGARKAQNQETKEA
jgi:hypothetical protein